MYRNRMLWLLPGLLLAGCQGTKEVPDKGLPTMQISSTAFAEGAAIPKQFTADGKDVSPPFSWSGEPPNTKSFALICDDPDAPRAQPWVHWVLFNVPNLVIVRSGSATTSQGLDGAVPTTPTLPSGGRQGKNDFGRIGYGGPAPPAGKPHRYFFKLYALDSMLELKEGATKAQLEQAMKGHILAQGQLMGTYQR